MEKYWNHAPCGFLTLSYDGNLLSINQKLLDILDYNESELVNQHIDTVLARSTRLFFQFYFLPLILEKKQVEEMYITLLTKSGKELPILINASLQEQTIFCVIVPMTRRTEYENQVLTAKKEAEASKAKLEEALHTIEHKQKELAAVNRQNEAFKIETQKELQLAKKIQETLLTKPVQNKNIQIESYYKASKELSGDIYGFYRINQYQYGIIIMDVMGHGISSSMITMSLHSRFQKLITKGKTPQEIMQELDGHLHHLFHNHEEAWHYCTAIYLLIDTKQQRVEYVNAGHPPAIYQSPEGKQQELATTMLPIGSFHNINFPSEILEYEKGGRFFLYTDGVSEPLEPTGLLNLLHENVNTPPFEFKKRIIHDLSKASLHTDKQDDKCFIIVDLK
ncbi:SpoIIE family protein phosphatase [Gracilibacillus sp. YIM 98692]|uniref:SpoIIE family protein phosphatase n=1 Tax=Gracilibacillus sp. YIM 98692 TaxID=2663532 RepID=UPI0013D402F6|nr:SpoIIE family protein phosphatase [Gracilibacillus sp. YIM 98692]